MRIKEKVKIKFNFTCMVCENESEEVHHINFNDSDNREENLMTLCKKCHKGIHKLRKANMKKKRHCIEFKSLNRKEYRKR